MKNISKKNNVEINDESDLKFTIQDWIDYDCTEIMYDRDDYEKGNIAGSFNETTLILNMEELVEEFSYLIQVPKSRENYNCCSQYTTIYCPECGKKLN